MWIVRWTLGGYDFKLVVVDNLDDAVALAEAKGGTYWKGGVQDEPGLPSYTEVYEYYD